MLPFLMPPNQQAPVCVVPLTVSICSHCSTSTYEWKCAVFFHFCVSLLRRMASSMSLQKTWSNSFLCLHSILWCICTTFSLSSLSLMGILVASMSKVLWIVLQLTYMCVYLYNRMIYMSLDIYSVMRWLGQMVFLLLDLRMITTVSSTMVELIYTTPAV